MTVIKASCPSCGDVELTPRQVRLVVCSLEDRSFYSFSCSECGDEVKKPAGGDVVALLRTGGVLPERWVIPAEALEAHDGPALCHDDLLDFVLWLESADLVSAAAQSTDRGRPTGESATL